MTGIEGTIIRLGAVATALAAIAALLLYVPPFKNVARYVWRNLVTGPASKWWRTELHESVAPMIDAAVRATVPDAVAAAVKATVEPAVDVVRDELRGHMAAEEEAHVEATVQRRRQADAVEQIDHRLTAIEASVGRRLLTGTLTLTDTPEGEGTDPPAGLD